MEAVHKALKVGYRHLDSAQAYGNEADVGRAISESGLDRSEIFLSTKLSEPADYGKDGVRHRFASQLEMLQTSYLDLYMLHSPGPKEKLKETWRAMESLYDEGKVRALGVSNFDKETLKTLLKFAKHRPVYCQNKFSVYMPGEQAPTQKSIMKYLNDSNIQLTGYSVINPYPMLLNQLEDPHIIKIAKRVGRTPSQVLHRWALQLGAVVLPKSATKERIAENFKLFDFQLSDADMHLLSALSTLGGSGAEKPLPYVTDIYGIKKLEAEAEASAQASALGARPTPKPRKRKEELPAGKGKGSGELDEAGDAPAKGKRKRRRKTEL
mmetsp:Transcript_4113/g.10343  ORF Transcript_4113/g.10343 Transcript_4113/m.10343 type:complete len:324 (+) Transcript_4113:2-973(+)